MIPTRGRAWSKLLVEEYHMVVWWTSLYPKIWMPVARLFLEVMASLPDASLTFLPLSIKCFPGTGEITDVDCVFKALFVRVIIVDKMDHELAMLPID